MPSPASALCTALTIASPIPGSPRLTPRHYYGRASDGLLVDFTGSRRIPAPHRPPGQGLVVGIDRHEPPVLGADVDPAIDHHGLRADRTAHIERRFGLTGLRLDLEHLAAERRDHDV